MEKLSRYEQWMDGIYRELETLLEVSRSDAQSIADAKAFLLAQAWAMGYDSIKTARLISEASE